MKQKTMLFLSMLLFGANSIFAEIVEREYPVFGEDSSMDVVIDGKTSMYMYNVGAKKFFCGGNNWGTRASLAEQGYRVFFESCFVDSIGDASIVYFRDSCLAKNGAVLDVFFAVEGGDCYVDRSSQPDYYWKIEKNEDNGFYRLSMAEANPNYYWQVNADSCGRTYFGWNPINGTVVNAFTPVSENTYVDWAFYSVAAYDAYQKEVEKYNVAESLKNSLLAAIRMDLKLPEQEAVYNNVASTIEELNAAIEAVRVAIATKEEKDVDVNNPVDKTPLIQSASFDDNKKYGWEGSIPALNFETAEFYQTNFDIYQVITDLPNGVYAVSVQSFLRPGLVGAESWNRYVNNIGNDAVLYVTNGVDSSIVSVPYIFEGASYNAIGLGLESRITDADYLTCYTPNDMESANAYFADAERGFKYKRTMIVSVVDGTLKIGARQNAYNAGYWFEMDNWTLQYYGKEATIHMVALNRAREEMLSYANLLGGLLEFAGLKDELMIAYEQSTLIDETSVDSVKVEIARLGNILVQVAEGHKTYGKLEFLIEKCSSLVELNLSEELTAAWDNANVVLDNKETASSADYLLAYKTLNSAYTFCMNELDVSDFNFSSEHTIGDFIVGLDETYNVAQIYYYTGTDVNVVIPDILTYNNKEYVVVSLGDVNGDFGYGSIFGYYGNVDASSIQSVKLPATLRCIGQYAFMYCSSLTEIEIPNSVEMLGYGAFYNCSSLSSMTIPAKVNSIGSDVFYGCNNLHVLYSEAVEAPSCDGNLNSNIRVVYVPVGSGSSYRSASYWKNYIIVDGEGVSVTVNVETSGTLGELVLAQTENLSDVNYLTVTGSLDGDDIYNIQNRMPNLLTVDLSGTDLTSLPDNIFYQRYALQEVVLPTGLNSIGQLAFDQCYSIQNMELPTTLTTIGICAFRDCDNLTSVEIPKGVTQLSNSAFYGCNKLETVIFNEGLQTIFSSAFGYCISLKEVDFPASLKTIGSYAFGNCSNLSRVVFKEGLTTLQYEAFEYCHALTEVTLPSTLMYCYYPFYYCNNLKTVKCLSLIPPANEDNRILYSDNMESCVLYVPAWTINKYKLTKGWDQFQTIKPLDNYWPENIALMDEFTLTLPDSLPVDYKPNLSLMHTDDNSYSYYNWMYGALSVNGNQTLSLGTVKMVYDQNMFYDYGRNYAPWYTSLVNNAAMRADSICITLYLRDDRWAFVSFPFDVKVSDIQAMSENTNFVIRKYSGKARAEANFDNTWQDMTVDSVLHAGEGYIWQCSSPNENYCGFYVSAVNNANKNLMFANETRAIALNEYQAEFSHNRSWNLIGNPFPCYYDTRAMEFTAPITVWNEYYSTYEAYSPMDDDYILRPGEAFFVQRPIDKESISFPTDGRQTNWEVKERSTYNGARSVSAPRQVFNLSLNMDSLSDRTRFVINADAEMGYDMSRDACKFMSSDSRVPQLFTVEGDVRFAINERPMGNGVIALGTYFGSEGTYTLALDTEVQTEVILVDKLTGKEVNLAAADYTFSAEAGTVTDRFEIKFGGATSVEENLAQQVSVQAVGGQIVVNGADASVYTADGKLVATVQGNSALDVPAGLYVVKAQGKSYKVSVVK